MVIRLSCMICYSNLKARPFITFSCSTQHLLSLHSAIHNTMHSSCALLLVDVSGNPVLQKNLNGLYFSFLNLINAQYVPNCVAFCQEFFGLIISLQKLKFRTVSVSIKVQLIFQMSFRCHQFPPKNIQKQVNLRYYNSKVEFICSFFGGNHSLTICF